jgi:hypothetical protein
MTARQPKSSSDDAVVAQASAREATATGVAKVLAIMSITSPQVSIYSTLGFLHQQLLLLLISHCGRLRSSNLNSLLVLQLRSAVDVICAGPVHLEQLRGRLCFGGLDLSTTTDVTALAWVFPPEDGYGLWQVLSRYFLPEENLRRRAERDRVPYDLWAAQGFIEATPGNVVDYGAIEERIRRDSARFDVREIAYDPWNATHTALRLQRRAPK